MQGVSFGVYVNICIDKKLSINLSEDVFMHDLQKYYHKQEQKMPSI